MLKTVVLLYFLMETDILIFSGLFVEKEVNLFEIMEIFCNNINVFTVTFAQFNAHISVLKGRIIPIT